ncbi:ECF transporter S component [Fusibacter bizertensis]|uniref:ECF transporter S component n=1 Tax=Fusibacter bizertensis TaxID=1488331 RepID=A0ABT6ND57_9FIRM|nr:ECF transporter S component [Fusibacter bizertensis]MDH8678310.1 ECF transporter S component [Fusibacter bizertensis]
MNSNERNKTMLTLTRTAVLLSLALIFQVGFNQFAQPAVGPLVNMTLIIAAIVVGPISAVIIGCLTPLVAFFLGIMPLLPVVPFIMIANTLLVLTFSLFKGKFHKFGAWIGVVLAAVVKASFLAISIRYLVVLFVEKVPPKLIAAFSLPQLYTALIGGVLAVIIAHYLSGYLKNQEK